ncbi:short chain dehydrogenase [Xylariaceae sp. FL0594]|nr:short chain dehydrogenase [Xylariaceae sp. FL0594]
MGRIFITGSSDGIGLLAAKELVKRGHEVYLHARNAQRAADAKKACPGAADVLVADLTSIPQTKALAASVSRLSPLDCVFHNAGLYLGPFRACPEADGYPAVFAVNVLAPYILTCLVSLPKRLIYSSSDSHWGGSADVEQDFGWRERGGGGGKGGALFSPANAYADTKLYNTMFGYAFARVFAGREGFEAAHSIDPGWVPTKMGGAGAPGDLGESVRMYIMLAEGAGEARGKTGCFWMNGERGPATPKRDALDEKAQDALLKKLEQVTGVAVP